jgi:iron complex outermembrane receptor protein
MRIKLLLLFSGIASLCLGQTGSVRGRVSDVGDKTLPGVAIVLKGTAFGTNSAPDGTFVLRDIPEGNYTIIMSMIGFRTHEHIVIVKKGEATELPPVVLQEDQHELSEVVITGNRDAVYVATKPSESLRLNADLIEIPQNIQVATKQTLLDMGFLSKGEIARISSGITKSYGGALDMTLQIRGTNATYGTYRNGVGGPIWWNAQEDVAMIERIEFVKGPAGFMLANAEPGGLVNTVTKQPVREQISTVSFGLGSFNMMRVALDLGGEVKKNSPLTYRLNAGFQRNNDFYHFGEFSRFFVCPVLKYEFNEKTSLTLEYNYVQAKTQENTHSLVSINGDFRALPQDLAINDPNNENFLGADSYTRIHLKHKLNDHWTFNAQAAYMSTDWDGTSLYLSGISPGKDTLYRASSLSNWTGTLYNTQLFLDGEFATGQYVNHKILAGIDFGDGTEGSTYGGTWGENKFPLSIANPTYYLPKDSLRYTGETGSWIASNRWMALYLQDHVKLFDKVILTVAARFTNLTTGQDWNTPPDDPEYELTNKKITPRLGLTYLVAKEVSIYALHDESFLSQRGAIFGGGRLPVLTGSNNEIGVKALLFQKLLSIGASVYDIRKNNIGTADQLHDGFYLKTGQIRSKGFDVDIMGKITGNLVVNANYSYVDARITKDANETLIGLRNAGTASNLSNVWLKYTFSHGLFRGLGLGAGMQYTGNRSGVSPGLNSADGNRYLPAYTLFDASVSYATDKFNVGVNVYNVANTRYASNGWYYPEFNEWMFDVGAPVNFRIQTNIKLQ